MLFVENITFPHVFSKFPEDFGDSKISMEKSKRINRTLSGFSIVFSIFTIYIVMKHSSKIKPEYRNILFSQLLLAGLGAIFMSVISPYMLLPYPALLITGPLVFNHKVTLYLHFHLNMIYFLPTMFLLSFGLIYNFMSIKIVPTQILNSPIDKFLKLSIFSVTLILLTFNSILFMVVFHMDHESLESSIIKNLGTGEEVLEIFDDYGAFIFDINSWPVFVASLQALLLSFLTLVLCFILTALSWREYEKQKQFLSSSAARNHRMMLFMLISYVLHFLMVFAVPLTLFTISLHNKNPMFGSFTFTVIMFPAHVLGMSLSFTYCIIITPYRNVVCSYIYLLTCTHPSNRCYDVNQQNLQLSTIENSSIFRRNSMLRSSSHF